MKYIRLTLLFLALSAASILLFGCAQPPKEEEKAAKDAIAAARDAEAPVYASREWSDADQRFTMAETKMASKDYDEAKKLLLEASEKAKIAKETAEKNKSDLVTELAQSKETAQNAIEHVKTEFNKQHKKVAKKAAATIETTIRHAETDLASAERSILGGNLMDAKPKLAAASSKAAEATSALATAMTAKHKPMATKHTQKQGTKYAPKKRKK